MRIFIVFIIWLMGQTVFAQRTSLSVFVSDELTGDPIPNSTVRIKEADFSTKTTGSDGIVFFNKSIPIGEIHYDVTVISGVYKKVEGTFNVTTESKSNTLNIKLSKIKPNEDRILIQGEVLDKNGQELENALVEVKVADLIKTTMTDKSGNYQIEVILNKTIYSVNMIAIEVKIDNNCKTNRRVELTRSNLINLDFKLTCDSNKKLNPSDQILDLWDTYQSLLKNADSFLINSRNVAINKQMLIDYNQKVLSDLKNIALKNVDLSFSTHLFKHIMLGEEFVSWLKSVDSQVSKDLRKEGVSMRRNLIKLLDEEKKLADYLTKRYDRNFFITHHGTGFL